MKRKENSDILIASQKVKNLLYQRIIKELNLSYHDVEKDAKRLGTKGIFASNLSRYFKTPYPVYGGLKHSNIVWLCLRYGISIRLYCDLVDYKEKDCIETLKKYFDIKK